jgi:hypothetical protein
MITFKQFYLKENLFYNDADNGAYNITYVPGYTNLSLGDPNADNQTLVCKFVNEYASIKGDMSGPIQTNLRQYHKKNGIMLRSELESLGNMVYIGYRSIAAPAGAEDDIRTLRSRQRIAAMAAIKGTANAIKQNPLPQAGYHALNAQQYYNKEHFAMTEAEYNEFVNRAVNGFLQRIGNDQKYGIFVYPDSRSENARDICIALKNIIGSDHAYITSLPKLIVSIRNVRKIFDVDRLATTIYGRLNREEIEEREITLDGDIKPAVELVLLDRNLMNFRGRTLSTASDTRPVRMAAFERAVCGVLGFNAPQQELGGRLNDYTNSHYDIEAFEHDRKQHTSHKRIFRTGSEAQTYQSRINQLHSDKPMRDRIAANTNILFVDDNINSGDLYKQVTQVATSRSLAGRHPDFFYLMCKQDYAN